jgi:hypothetical protein
VLFIKVVLLVLKSKSINSISDREKLYSIQTLSIRNPSKKAATSAIPSLGKVQEGV